MGEEKERVEKMNETISKLDVECMIEALEKRKKTKTFPPQIDRIENYINGLGYILGRTVFDDNLTEEANKIKKQRKSGEEHERNNKR